jgi:hypothetical protein
MNSDEPNNPDDNDPPEGFAGTETPPDETILRRRKEVVRRFLKGAGIEEIAEAVGASPSTIKRDVSLLGLRKIKRTQVDQRWLKQAVAETIGEIEAEENAQASGVKTCPETGRRYNEVEVQTPPGAFKEPDASDFGVIPLPELLKGKVVVVSADPAAGRFVQRHYLD